MFPVSVTVRQLAALVQGRVEGDADLVIQAARPVQEAQAGHITFIDHERHLPKVRASQVSAVVAGAEIPPFGKTVIRVAEPLTAFIVIAQKLHPRAAPPPGGIDPRAAVDAGVSIGSETSIAPFATIGAGSALGARCRIHSGVSIGRDCKLGDDVVLHANVVLYDGTILGDRVIVHAGAVLGADGFGYRFQQGRHVKVPQLGYVEIAADVEIGANACIDRGTFGSTRIGAGTKIDNLVQVAHNVQIGNHVILVSQVGIAGSTTIGNHVIFAGQSGATDHVDIGDGAQIAAKSGVMRDVLPGARMLGFPARPYGEQMRTYASMEKVPNLYKDMQRVKKHLGLTDEPNKLAG
jgi:UDP-3-O-[3-hydroxymyristoyl] glucosamine N-acyltransferase